jgi:hypothetical protein
MTVWRYYFTNQPESRILPVQHGFALDLNDAKAALLEIVLREALGGRLQPDFSARITDGKFANELELELVVTERNRIVSVNWRRPGRPKKKKTPRVDAYAILAASWGCSRDEAKERAHKSAWKGMPHAI